MSASLVEAMMMPDVGGDAGGGIRAGLVLDPVRQGVSRCVLVSERPVFASLSCARACLVRAAGSLLAGRINTECGGTGCKELR